MGDCRVSSPLGGVAAELAKEHLVVLPVVGWQSVLHFKGGLEDAAACDDFFDAVAEGDGYRREALILETLEQLREALLKAGPLLLWIDQIEDALTLSRIDG